MKGQRTALSYLLLFLVFFVPSVAFALHSANAEDDKVKRAEVYLEAVGFTNSQYFGVVQVDERTTLPGFRVETGGEELTVYIRTNPDGSYYLATDIIADSFSSSFDFYQKAQLELKNIERSLLTQDSEYFRKKKEKLQRFSHQAGSEIPQETEGWP